MEPIHVPGPPKEAFNKNRRISDLIKAQVNHFKHLEEKLPPEVRATLPQHRIVTEDDAARYLAPMTRLFRSRVAAVAKTVVEITTPVPVPQATGLSLAAGAETENPPTDAKNRPFGTAKKSVPRPRKRKK